MSNRPIDSQLLAGSAMPDLPAGVAQLRCLDLDKLDTAALDETPLSERERARADRFVTATLRRRYIGAHLFLRHVLANACGTGPAQLVFDENEWGKPTLADYPRIHFNLSHSQQMALLGISTVAPIGVDIEHVKRWADDELQSLSKTIMTASEQRALQNHPAPAQALITAWTRKEACVKALGLGLSYGVQTLDVGLSPTPCQITAAANSESLLVACQLDLSTIEGPRNTIASVATRHV